MKPHEAAELDALIASKAEQLDLEQAPEWFHEGQLEAWARKERVILLLSGTQGGKTVTGPPWLLREIGRKGPGEYGVVGPTFALLFKKAIPEFRKLFVETLRLGRIVGSPIPMFEFSEEGLMRVFGKKDEPCTVFFGYAENPDSLESTTLKGVWADEAGQKAFKLDSYEALQRRLAINKGRILITTTPYVWHWLKTKIHDKATRLVYSIKKGILEAIGKAGDPTLDAVVINFPSILNPSFHPEEYERQKAQMAPWKHKMMYDGLYTKPAGVVFDCFDRKRHVVKNFPIPDDWVRLTSHDFGPVNMAAWAWAWNPIKKRFHVYKTYHTGGRTEEEHVAAFRSMIGRGPLLGAMGGAPSEDDWRRKFAEAGYPIGKPSISDLKAGIQQLYALFKTDKAVFHDNCETVISHCEQYSYKLDSNDEPTEEIEDKASWHLMDAGRYGAIMVSDWVPPVVADRFADPHISEDEEEKNEFAHLGWS